MRIKDIINTIMYKYYASLNEFLLVVVDRTSESGVRYIEFTHVRRADNNYLYISSSLGDDMVIPIHRVVRIEKKTGEIVWSRNA